MKLISFYLPQFHEIPENNEWWGKGFTEWTNMKKARPLYLGHYQPREPFRDNYYDLSEPQVMVDQMKLAKKYGIDGFCFYHYWFGGKKLLEKPLEQMLVNKKADLPFCLAWANEPWTRAWDGMLGSKEVLMPQVYGGEEEWKKHFEYLLPFFQDKRYICVDGKPVFIIYRAKNIPKCQEMMEYWNQLAVKSGLQGLYYIQMNTAFGIDKNNRKFNASLDFEPMRTYGELGKVRHRIWKLQAELYYKLKAIPIISKLILFKIDFDSFYQSIISRSNGKRQKNFYGAFSGWDNTPRKGRQGLIITGSTPKKFEKYLEIQVEKSIREGNEFLFINAWNEWAEGAYLEPDKKYGYAYLKAIKRVSDTRLHKA
jgi:lipopolysaccharide biosynthesis protein